jgi:preprotein translocase subunit YajC
MRLSFLLCLLSFIPASAFAQSLGGGSGLSSLGGLTPLLLLFVFFYLFIIRPQQKKSKEHQKQLNALKKDDRIITSGGIYATVVGLKGNVIDIKIADEVTVQVSRQAVSSVITKEDEESAKVPEIVRK